MFMLNKISESESESNHQISILSKYYFIDASCQAVKHKYYTYRNIH